jgi:TonB family protein
LNDRLFQRCLAASLALHAGLWLLASWKGCGPAPEHEIDLTATSFLGGTGPAKLGAPKALVPKAKGIALPSETKTPLPAQVEQKPKDWVAPGPDTKTLEKPPEEAATPGGAMDGTGTAAKTGGSGQGSDFGVPGGTGDGGADLVALPRLLNGDEVRASLRRFYPESERRAGREGKVLVHLHINSQGQVDPVDVVASAGPAFDSAARAVARLMRFSPALGRSGPVAVKLPQSIVFRLQD